MRRRTVLSTVAVSVGSSLAGCLTSRVDSIGNSSGAEARDYPETPENITAETATEFGREYAKADLHNSVINENVIDTHIQCDTSIDRELGDEFYVMSMCDVSFSGEHDGSEYSAHVGEMLVPMIVSENRVVIISRDPDRNKDQIEYRGASPYNRSVGPGLLILNFDDDEYGIKVGISSTNEEQNTVFAENYSLIPQSGVIYSGLIEESGQYRVGIALEQGRSETYRWTVTDETQPTALGIYVTPDTEININPINYLIE